MKILVTGANGFVGKSLSAELFVQGNTVQGKHPPSTVLTV